MTPLTFFPSFFLSFRIGFQTNAYLQEWLISAPKHVALYQAFGWTPPIFAHLGLLVNPDGTKLSKRNADVNLSQYKTGRIFPAALLSWLANLGSSFKSNVKPPRSVDDIAEAVIFLSLSSLSGKAAG